MGVVVSRYNQAFHSSEGPTPQALWEQLAGCPLAYKCFPMTLESSLHFQTPHKPLKVDSQSLAYEQCFSHNRNTLADSGCGQWPGASVGGGKGEREGSLSLDPILHKLTVIFTYTPFFSYGNIQIHLFFLMAFLGRPILWIELCLCPFEILTPSISECGYSQTRGL